MQWSDYAETIIVNHFFRGVAYTPAAMIYLALFTSATADDGTGTEATGGSYARQPVTFSAAAAGAIANSADVEFSNMAAATYSHAAIYDAVSGGNMLAHGALTASKTAPGGQPLLVAAGDLDVYFSASSDATTYLRNAILDRLLRNQAWTPPTVYAALYESATDASGGGTEITGGSYTRQAVTFVAPTNGVTSNDGAVTFSGLPDQTGGPDPITNFAILDASSGGNMLAEDALASSFTPASGDAGRFPLGDLTLTVR